MVTEQQKKPKDKRKAPRFPVETTGIFHVNGRHEKSLCTIVDLSALGLRVYVQGVPQDDDLVQVEIEEMKLIVTGVPNRIRTYENGVSEVGIGFLDRYPQVQESVARFNASKQ